MKFIFIFIDGIGFGKEGDFNPFTLYPCELFSPLSGKQPVLSSWAADQKQDFSFKTEYQSSNKLWSIKAIDPSSGIKGLPQSGTGQTSLFTGVNAPLVLERHDANFPSFTLKKFIKKFSLIKVLNENNISATLINSYSPYYFKHIHPRSRFHSASTLTQLAAGIPLMDFFTLNRDESLYMDITHDFLIAQFEDKNSKYREGNWEGIDIENLLQRKDPSEQGKHLLELSRKYNYTLFEYFLTDKLGHSGDIKGAKKIINDLDNFLTAIINNLQEDETLLVSADHGNFEDMRVKHHTFNAVPLIAAGSQKDKALKEINILADIPRFILSSLGLPSEHLKNAHKLKL